MITDDEVMRLFERADPARTDDATPLIDATGYLDALRTRSNTMTVIDTRPPSVEPPSRQRWAIISAAAAAALVLIVVGIVALAADDRTETPIDQPAPVTTVAPTTLAAEQTARAFLDAYGALDADRAMAYLSAEALGQMSGTPEQFRLELGQLAAIGFKHTVTSCEPLSSSEAGVRLRCDFDLHALRSDELGLGPFRDNFWDFNILDGQIIAASYEWAFMENGFSKQMWEPFEAWVSAEYPEDAAVIYTDGSHTMQSVTEEASALWELRSREYVDTVAAHQSRARSICAMARSEASAATAAANPRPRADTPAYFAILAPFLDEALAEIATVAPPEAARTDFEQVQVLGQQVVDLWSGAAQAPTIDVLSDQLMALIGGVDCTFGWT